MGILYPPLRMGVASCSVSKPCECLEIFQLSGVHSRADSIAATNHDLGEAKINLKVLNRMREVPLTKEQSANLEHIFKDIDRNHNETIHTDEMKKYFSAHYNLIRPDELDELMTMADKDNSGELDVKEFKRVAQKILA